MSDQDGSEKSHVKAKTAPDPDDPRKPAYPTDLAKPTRKFILKNTAREFMDDECTDIAAARLVRAAYRVEVVENISGSGCHLAIPSPSGRPTATAARRSNTR